MYSGEERQVTLECDNELANNFVDRYGLGYECEDMGDSFRASVMTTISPTFFGWLAQYAGAIRIIEPDDVRTQYREHLLKSLE